MKLRTIALATLLALTSTAYASATSHHRHRHMTSMHHGMAGPSGPSLDGGGVDRSRVGGMGTSRKPE